MPARWTEPVIINAPFSGRLQVKGSFEALVILMDEWPDLRGAG